MKFDNISFQSLGTYDIFDSIVLFFLLLSPFLFHKSTSELKNWASPQSAKGSVEKLWKQGPIEEANITTNIIRIQNCV